MSRDRSREIMRQARIVLPGGVNSPVRSFRSVGGDPVVVARGRGSRIWDVDGNQYIDYVGSYGPLILGHANAGVIRAVAAAARRGTSFGAPTEAEVELASFVIERIPSVEVVRFVSSGTEAAMSAIRLARAATRRDLVVKFDGCYHGHADGLLAAAGSGVATLGLPDSAGVPASFARLTLVARYNDRKGVERVFRRYGERIAAVIVEPVAANMGVVFPEAGFLEALRSFCTRAGSLLIFDEVITGFRLGPGGAQEMAGVLPDLTVLGKVVGGGLPVGAYGGRKDLMALVAPVGPVYQAGTLSGNPIAMAAGIAALRGLDQAVYSRLDALGARLQAGLEAAAASTGSAASVTRAGSLLTLFFRSTPPRSFDEAKESDTARFARFHGAMLDRGIHLPPSQFEAWFLSSAHTEADIDRTVAAAQKALAAAQAG